MMPLLDVVRLRTEKCGRPTNGRRSSLPIQGMTPKPDASSCAHVVSGGSSPNTFGKPYTYPTNRLAMLYYSQSIVEGTLTGILDGVSDFSW